MEYNLASNTVFFFSISTFVLSMSLGVLFAKTTIRSLMYLVLSMLGIGLVFIAQGAVFLGGVQFAVYAGAVMVLFLMVLMLSENDVEDPEPKASIGKFIKIGSVGVFLGLVAGALSLKSYSNSYDLSLTVMEWTKNVSKNLFLENMLLFELIGVLLLVIAVAVIAVNNFEEEENDGH